MEARPYPTRLLEGCESALLLFSAAFLGHNDAIHFAEAGVPTTCVDRDGDRLREMAELYPDAWEFVQADAFTYIVQNDHQWDIVSADPWTADFQAVADCVGRLCDLAGKAVTIGTGMRTRVKPPAGWHVTDRLERSTFRGGVYWTVIERT
jgi:hypothetical protein